MDKNKVVIVARPEGLDNWGALPRALRASAGTVKVVRVLATMHHGSYHSLMMAAGWRLRSRTKGKYKYLWLEPLDQKEKRDGKR